MNHQTKMTTGFFLCGVLMIGALGGCAGRNSSISESRTHTTPEESTFAAGAGRAPTAATSYSFAKILVSQGRDRDALYVLSHIIREHPKFPPAYNEMASVYVRADRLDDAIEVLTTGLKQSQHDAVLHNNLGMCYLLKQDADEALIAFTRATEIVPTNPTFRSNRAAALALTEREAEAASEYSTVLSELQTQENMVILARARAARGISDQEESKIDLEKDIQADLQGAGNSEIPPGK
jgi:Flp pilus assembly protein TadD